MGSSDAVAFLEGEYYLLLAVQRRRAGASCVGQRPAAVAPTVFDEDGSLRETALDEDRTYVVTLRDLPGEYSFATLFSQRAGRSTCG